MDEKKKESKWYYVDKDFAAGVRCVTAQLFVT